MRRTSEGLSRRGGGISERSPRSPRCSRTSMPFLHRLRAGAETGMRATRARQERPSAWVTTAWLPSVEGVGAEAHRESRWVSPRAARTWDSAHWDARRERRPAAVVGRAGQLGRRATGAARPGTQASARSSSRAYVSARQRRSGSGRSDGHQGLGEASQDPAGRHPRSGRRERPPAHGAAHRRAPAVGAHEQHRVQASLAHPAGTRRQGRRCRGRGRPSRDRAARRGRRPRPRAATPASRGPRPGMGEQHAPSPPSCAGWPPGRRTSMKRPPARLVRASSSAPSSGSRCDSRAASRPHGPDCSTMTKKPRSRSRAVGARAVGVPLHRAGVVSGRAVAGRVRVLVEHQVLVGRDAAGRMPECVGEPWRGAEWRRVVSESGSCGSPRGVVGARTRIGCACLRRRACGLRPPARPPRAR